MESLFNILQANKLTPRAGPTLKSRRAETVKKFVDRLNSERSMCGLKPLSARFIAIRMAHLDQWDLDIFYGSCCDASNFSSYWWWALKPKKDGKKKLDM